MLAKLFKLWSNAVALRDLLGDVKALREQVEHLYRVIPGRCGSCGRETGSVDLFWCHEDCRRSWVEQQGRKGKTA